MTQDGWQPISTVPRDNTRVIALLMDDVCIAWWHDSSLWRVDDRGMIRVYPDGWMPLPPPPESAP